MSRKLNILLVNETSGPGGAETVVFETARNLNPERFNSSVVLFRPGWFLGHLKDHGIKAKVIESRRSWDISFMIRLGRYCRENSIDLLHAHLPGANLYCSVIGKFIGIPVVTTTHNEYVMPGHSDKYLKIKHFIIRNLASKNILVADYMQADYIKLGHYSKDSLMTIHNGTHFSDPPEAEELYKLRNNLALNEDDLLIGNIANLRRPKGHDHLIEAAGIVCREIPQAKFLLIGDEGDGKIRERLDKRIAELGIESNIIFLGFRKDVPLLRYLLDIFVLSSISEGLPLSVVEAMAAELPVVVTDVGGLSEVVEDSKTGYIVPPADPQALAEKLMLLAKDKVLRKSMGISGHQRAKTEFSMETMMSKYENLFLSLIK